MSCESCYNGCVQTVSDECVRYTGLDSVPLDIVTGDNLQVVIDNIINHLVPLLSGTGDKITIADAIRCAIVDGNLPTPVGTDQWTSEQLFQTLVKVACELQTQITAIDSTLATLNADYTISCLTGVTASSDTHAIVQAIITKLCATIAELAAFELDVETNYVKLADFDALVAAYLASQTSGTQQYLKMVPYAVYEYYGPLTNFDGTGAGLVSAGFYKVYLCNGLNGTPDKRGRVTVGAIKDVPSSIPLDAAVNPANAGNPNYAVYDTTGQNTVVLNINQIPAHNHPASTTSVSSPHSHSLPNTYAEGGNAGHIASGGTSPEAPMVDTTGSASISIISTTTIQDAGGGQAHANIQPVIAAYYIMYIP